MKELSLNILDIAQNSVTAKSTVIYITIEENKETLSLVIEDDGCGMKPEMVESVTDPFCTTRKTRKVGLGIPFLKMEAEMTGGNFKISSKHIDEYPNDHGTQTYAFFYKNHLDYTPLGDIISTVCTLIQGCGDIDVVFRHTDDGKFDVNLDTRELKAVLGKEISLAELPVLEWIKSYLVENYNNINA